MDATNTVGPAKASSATAYLRSERATFRLMPVPSPAPALSGWNQRLADWAAS